MFQREECWRALFFCVIMSSKVREKQFLIRLQR
nr:MAG TPA: pre-60S ribosomal subunit-60S, ribosome biogenesis, LSU processome.6A [Caudoviricetes sp.]